MHAGGIVPNAAAFYQKSGFVTGILSCFPGLGHVYLGAYRRGFAFALAFVLDIVILSHGAGSLEVLFGMAIPFIWFFGLIDALRICRAINAGAGLDVDLLAPSVPKASARAATLTWGIILIGIGFLFVADRYFDMERFFEFVGHNIGFILIGLGFVLLAAYARRRARERDLELASPPGPPPPSVAT
jgi:hypothetical protein